MCNSLYTKVWSVCCLEIWLFKLLVNKVVDAYSLLSKIVKLFEFVVILFDRSVKS
jgi:hypothetical protein